MIFSSLSGDAISDPLMESVARQVYEPGRGWRATNEYIFSSASTRDAVSALGMNSDVLQLSEQRRS